MKPSVSSKNATKVVDVDVVVIGAGVSGLTAAYTIHTKDPGIRLAVVEAKDRVGGRTAGQTLKAASGQDSWDLGGQWIGSCQRDILQMVKELGLSVYEQYAEGTKLMQLNDEGIVSKYVSEIPSLPLHALVDLHLFMRKVEAMRQKIDVADPNLCRYAAEWDSITLEQFKQANMWTTAAKQSLDAALRCVFGTEATHLSLLFFLTYIAAAGGLEPMLSCRKDFGAQELKIAGGAWQVSSRLAESIDPSKIYLSTPVVAVRQETTLDTVLVETSVGQTFRCQRVILAIPPQQTVNIEFHPALPIIKRHVLQRMPAGNITKVIVTYSQAFWRTAGLSGEAVTSGGKSVISGCDKGPLCIIFDATSSAGNPAIVSFIGGDQHLHYSALSSEDRQKAVLHSLSELFGPDALQPLDYCEKNWSNEPYCSGGPVSVCTPGAMTQVAVALRQPFDRIHFAGTESATVWCGFMNGAVQSGRRAAMEVLYNIRPQSVTASDLDGTVYVSRIRHPKNPLRHLKPGRFTGVQWPLILGALACVAFFVIKGRRRPLIG